MTEAKREEPEALLAERSIDEAEAILLGEAGSALEEGNLRKLGYCLRKLREYPRPLIEAIARLLCGEHDSWKLEIARQGGAGSPGDPTTRMRDLWLGEKIAMASFAGKRAQAALRRQLKEVGYSRLQQGRALDVYREMLRTWRVSRDIVSIARLRLLAELGSLAEAGYGPVDVSSIR
jgi:hypothetical protein